MELVPHRSSAAARSLLLSYQQPSWGLLPQQCYRGQYGSPFRLSQDGSYADEASATFSFKLYTVDCPVQGSHCCNQQLDHLLVRIGAARAGQELPLGPLAGAAAADQASRCWAPACADAASQPCPVCRLANTRRCALRARSPPQLPSAPLQLLPRARPAGHGISITGASLDGAPLSVTRTKRGVRLAGLAMMPSPAYQVAVLQIRTDTQGARAGGGGVLHMQSKGGRGPTLLGGYPRQLTLLSHWGQSRAPGGAAAAAAAKLPRPDPTPLQASPTSAASAPAHATPAAATTSPTAPTRPAAQSPPRCRRCC
jgi:hypothetical protein